MPLLQQQTLSKLIETAQFSNALAILTVMWKILQDMVVSFVMHRGQVAAIVEDKDATAEQLAIHEINTGILAISNSKLQEWLPEIKTTTNNKNTI